MFMLPIPIPIFIHDTKEIKAAPLQPRKNTWEGFNGFTSIQNGQKVLKEDPDLMSTQEEFPELFN
jgi:hypothetical protein